MNFLKKLSMYSLISLSCTVGFSSVKARDQKGKLEDSTEEVDHYKDFNDVISLIKNDLALYRNDPDSDKLCKHQKSYLAKAKKQAEIDSFKHITKSTSCKEIIAVYKKLSLSYHSDRHGGCIKGDGSDAHKKAVAAHKHSMEEILKPVTNAHRILSDNDSKQRYDDGFREKGTDFVTANPELFKKIERFTSGKDIESMIAFLEKADMAIHGAESTEATCKVLIDEVLTAYLTSTNFKMLSQGSNAKLSDSVEAFYAFEYTKNDPTPEPLANINNALHKKAKDRSVIAGGLLSLLSVIGGAGLLKLINLFEKKKLTESQLHAAINLKTLGADFVGVAQDGVPTRSVAKNPWQELNTNVAAKRLFINKRSEQEDIRENASLLRLGAGALTALGVTAGIVFLATGLSK